MPLPSEYQEYLNANLNLFERMTQAFSALDERIDYSNILLTRLLGAQGLPPDVNLIEVLEKLSISIDALLGKLENPENFRVGQVLIAAAGTAQQLPEVIIPYDRQIVVKALRGNLGSAYVANTKADAEGTNTSYPLWANEAVGLFVSNADRIWVNTDNTGEGVVWIVEQVSSWLARTTIPSKYG